MITISIDFQFIWFRLKLFSTHIVQWIGCTVDTLGDQPLNAKGHFMLIFGRKSLAVQDELYDARANGSGKKAVLPDVEAARKYKIYILKRGLKSNPCWDSQILLVTTVYCGEAMGSLGKNMLIHIDVAQKELANGFETRKYAFCGAIYHAHAWNLKELKGKADYTLDTFK